MRLRVVLDTNVLISALLFGGPPGAILNLILEGGADLITSPALLAELERVLVTKFPHAQSAIWDTLAALKELAQLVEPTDHLSVITSDPEDNRVLECALAGRAQVVVSGDQHLLVLGSFRNIPILAPHAFIASLR